MKVEAVSTGTSHGIGKQNGDAIRLVEDLGVEGDVHAGATVKHRSRVRKDPTQPNLRQVHLIHRELHEELAAQGFEVEPGQMGENVTTSGVELLALPTGARLRLGAEAVVEVKGLRNPCAQLDEIAPGLMKAVLDRAADGEIVRKSGVMGVVLEGGEVRPGDPIEVELPAEPHVPLAPV
jgi:MOSC domain-containing protein YiiM